MGWAWAEDWSAVSVVELMRTLALGFDAYNHSRNNPIGVAAFGSKLIAMSGGGSRQRLSRALPDDGGAASRAASPSSLAAELLELWSWGTISTPIVHRLASAGIKDGCRCADLRRLAGVSAPTRHGSMQSALPASVASDALTSQSLILKASPKTLRPVDSLMLLPHELFAALWAWDQDFFVRHLCGGSADRIGQFWSAMEGHPALNGESPVAARADFRQKCIPLTMHGDGVACTGLAKSWSKSADALSWRSLLSKGSVKVTQFLIFVLSWSLMVVAGVNASWPTFLQKLAWSFQCLFTGKWPRRDYKGNEYAANSPEGRRAGQDLAGGYWACLWNLQGDLDFMHKAWGLAHASAGGRCNCCSANTSTHPWTDCSAGASWRATVWETSAGWAAAFPNRSVFFREVPGLSILNYTPDFMHIGHLGAYQYFLGSVLEYLVLRMEGTARQNLEILRGLLKAAYDRLGVEGHNRFPDARFVLSWFRRGTGEFPQLRGKAVHVKHLVEPLLEVAGDILKEGVTQTETWMLLGLRMLVTAERVLDKNRLDPWRLSVADANSFATSLKHFVDLSVALRSHFNTHLLNGGAVLLFHFTIKFHYLLHNAARASYENPRLSWCYSGESLMHLLRNLVASSSRGVEAIWVGNKVMQKYSQALSLELSLHRSC